MDDNFLNTGMTSASMQSPRQREVSKERINKSKESADERVKLLSGGEEAIKKIDEKIEKLCHIDYLHVAELVHSAQPHSLEIEMLANERAVALLKSVRNDIAMSLRKKDV